MLAGIRFCLMMGTKRFYWILGACCLLLVWLWQLPCLFVEGSDGFIAVIPARAGQPFSIHFIHSVQRTPVEENLQINGARNGFDLLSTKYQSFGVGLPFLASEGSFHEEGDYFVLDGMQRRFPSLSLRPGVGTELTLRIREKEYRLYELVPTGSRVDLYLAPYYKQWLSYSSERDEANDG